jgi:hypothetical protein
MAFPAMPRSEVRALAPGDRLYLYATRGAWGNPTRDRGRVIACAAAQSPVHALDTPIDIAGRSFASSCELAVTDVVPYPGGVELQPLVSRMAAFPKPEAWSVYLRRPLARLTADDATLLDKELSGILRDRNSAVQTYP